MTTIRELEEERWDWDWAGAKPRQALVDAPWPSCWPPAGRWTPTT